jgi:hypothetical protein
MRVVASTLARAPTARYVAWLDAGTGPATRCYVEDVSRFGARVMVFGPGIPAEFTLCFGRDGGAKVRCRVRSQGGPHCDVEFVASCPSH